MFADNENKSQMFFGHRSADDSAGAFVERFDLLENRPPFHFNASGPGVVQANATSPSQASEVAFMTGVDSTGKIVGTSFWTWDGNTPAHYATGAQASNAHKWGATTAGTAGGTVDYYFTPASNWTTTEKSVFTACLSLWSDICNIHFVQTTTASAAQLTITRGASGTGAFEQSGWSSSSSSVGNIGSTVMWGTTDGHVSIDTSASGFGPIDGHFSTVGGYAWMTVLHELGHALGLGHTGPYNEGSSGSNPDSSQFSAYDMRLWSVMSYIGPGETAAFSSQYPVTGTNWGTTTSGGFIYDNVPTTPMPLDIQAAQTLYGASTSTAYAGGQVFGFHCNITDITKEFFDFTVNSKPIVTIFDRGTGNTLDLSGFSSASNINLTAGKFSSCDGLVNNIGIAFGTKIDTATGGAGNDKIVANADGDTLNGGAGNDTLTGGTGNDTINGGTGIDHMAGGKGNDVYIVDSASDVVTEGASAGTDTVKTNLTSYTLGANVENLAHTGTTSFTGTGNTLNNSMSGAAGADKLSGSSGNDTLTGGAGADHLSGGAGNDVFRYTAASQSTTSHYDIITDYDALADKFDVPGTVSGINTALTKGALSTATFDTDLAKVINSAHLGAHHAVEFTPNSGTLKGDHFLVVDVNGTAGYQASADLVIQLSNPINMSHLAAGDFI